jgi:hypothetical protein
MKKMLSLIVILFSISTPLDAMMRRQRTPQNPQNPGVKFLVAGGAPLPPSRAEPGADLGVESAGAGEALKKPTTLQTASEERPDSRIGTQDLTDFLSAPRKASAASATDSKVDAAPVTHRRSSIPDAEGKSADDNEGDKTDAARTESYPEIRELIESFKYRSLRDRIRTIADANNERTMKQLELIYNEVKNICLGYEIIRFKLQPLRRGETFDPNDVANLASLMIEHYLLVAIQTKACKRLKGCPEGIQKILTLIQEIYLHWYEKWIKTHLPEKETLITAIRDQVKSRITEINRTESYSFIPTWLSEVDWTRRIAGIATGYDLNFNNIEATIEFILTRNIYQEEFVQTQLKLYHTEETLKTLRMIDDISLDDFFTKSTTERLMTA